MLILSCTLSPKYYHFQTMYSIPVLIFQSMDIILIPEYSKIIYPFLLIYTRRLIMKERCYYGCGHPPKYKLKNGRLCCSKFHSSCPGLKQRLGLTKKQNYKPHLTGSNPVLKCRKCGSIEPIGNFYDKGIKYVFCRQCRRDYKRADYLKRTKKNNPYKYKAKKALYSLRHKAKIGKEVDLTYFTENKLKEMFETCGDCPDCNEKMLIISKGPDGRLASLDRTDNSRGYIEGNVRVICHLCNGIKGAR